MATFRFRTTAAAVVEGLGVDLAGKTAVITGGNSGIGVETARALANAGADVVISSRQLPAGQAVADDINGGGARGKVTVKQLDLADLRSVEAFAHDISETLPKINLLIFNAGVMAVPTRQLTADGFELQTGTNHLGHFHLLQLLLPKLQKQKEACRVVVVSSYAHLFNGGTLPLDDLNWETRPYSAWRAYGQSKLCNVLMAKELARRAKEGGWPLKAYSLHPGSISTNLARHTGWVGRAFKAVAEALDGWMPGVKTVQQGAATTLYAALAPELDSQSGAYLQNCGVLLPSKLAQDAELAKALWVKSEEMLQAAVQARK